MALPRVGEITRPAILGKLEKIPFNKLVGTVLIERVVDLFITLSLALLIFIIQFQIITDFVQDLFVELNSSSIGLLLGMAIVSITTLYFAYIKRNGSINYLSFKSLNPLLKVLSTVLRLFFHSVAKGYLLHIVY